MTNNLIKYLVIDAKQTLGERNLLLEARPYAGYKEGIKGEQEGITVTCLSETMGYEKVDIKIAGLMELPVAFDGTPIPVEFEGLEAKVWQDWNNKGTVKLSMTAKGIKTLGGKQIKIGGEKE